MGECSYVNEFSLFHPYISPVIKPDYSKVQALPISAPGPGPGPGPMLLFLLHSVNKEKSAEKSLFFGKFKGYSEILKRKLWAPKNLEGGGLIS